MGTKFSILTSLLGGLAAGNFTGGAAGEDTAKSSANALSKE
jgi:hypothetical protein